MYIFRAQWASRLAYLVSSRPVKVPQKLSSVLHARTRIKVYLHLEIGRVGERTLSTGVTL